MNFKKILFAAGVFIGGGLLIWKYLLSRKNSLTDNLSQEEKYEIKELEDKIMEKEKRY